MSVEIRWQATQEHDADFLGGTKEQTTILPGLYAATDGYGAVADCCADYFNAETWDEYFGLDDSDATVRVRVREPVAIAGDYLVDLERVTTARARQLPAQSQDKP